MDKIFWVDLEMTGLDPDNDAILEIACIVTDLELCEIDCFSSIVYQPKEILAKMDEWNIKTHNESGLLPKVPHGKPIGKIEKDLIEFLKAHFSGNEIVMAGNTIYQDRQFIRKYMKNLYKKLHYRVIDVSSFKLLFMHKFDLCFVKENKHRALDDIRESINELKYYLQHIKC